MLNLNKSFIYEHTTTAIGSCDKSIIKEIISHSETVIENCSTTTIKFTILSMFNSIHTNNIRLSNLIADIKNIIETNDNTINKLDEKYDDICNIIYKIAETIIYSSIFVLIVSNKDETLNKYPRRLYEYIHDFKLTLYNLNLHFRYDWDSCIFEEENETNRYRINMFVFRSCGLKNHAIFNPTIDINVEYINYMDDLIKDINNLSFG